MPRFRQHNVYMKRVIQKPRRERLLVQQALKKLGIRCWQQVEFWSPDHVGRYENLHGGWQWLDFVVRMPYGKPGVILLYGNWTHSGLHRYQKREIETKKAFLKKKGLPYLILPRTYSQQEYEVRIEWWMRKETRHEKQNVRKSTAATRPD